MKCQHFTCHSCPDENKMTNIDKIKVLMEMVLGIHGVESVSRALAKALREHEPNSDWDYRLANHVRHSILATIESEENKL